MKSPASPKGLRVSIANDYEAMSVSAADFIEEQLIELPRLLLCASAGGSPTGCYEQLAERNQKTPKLCSQLRVLQIDEWGGLEPEHPATCRSYLERYLLQPLKIGSDRFERFQSDAVDQEAECERIQSWLAANGPIDICLLGLGLNGHIALNEPANEMLPGVHVSKLARSSLTHGMLKDLARKPRYGLTLGLADILSSRTILLLVSGESKEAVLRRLLEPRISPRFPASFLWLHPHVTIICDRAALPNEP